jgi:hypothetical protein
MAMKKINKKIKYAVLIIVILVTGVYSVNSFKLMINYGQYNTSLSQNSERYTNKPIYGRVIGKINDSNNQPGNRYIFSVYEDSVRALHSFYAGIGLITINDTKGLIKAPSGAFLVTLKYNKKQEWYDVLSLEVIPKDYVD